MTKAQIKKEIARIYAENIAYKYLPMAYQTGMKVFKEEVVNFISSKFSVSVQCPEHKKQLHKCGDGGYRCADCLLQ